MGNFVHEDPWRVFRIMGEFVEGFESLSRVGPAISIFGSARTRPGTTYYTRAERIAYRLSKQGYTIITGAGPGIMEAANKGAKRAKGRSIGLNIEVPVVQEPNPYITTLINFHYFFCRKVMFAKYSKAFVVLPGGYGTMDELFEALTLVQTKRVPFFPIIMVGREYWKGLVGWLEGRMMEAGCISSGDMKLFHLVDNPDEVLAVMKSFYHKKSRRKKKRTRTR